MVMARVGQTTCMRRAYSVLVWDVQTGSVAVPSDMPYLMYLLCFSEQQKLGRFREPCKSYLTCRVKDLIVIDGLTPPLPR